jgi:fructosamine-3-kinase
LDQLIRLLAAHWGDRKTNIAAKERFNIHRAYAIRSSFPDVSPISQQVLCNSVCKCV